MFHSRSKAPGGETIEKQWRESLGVLLRGVGECEVASEQVRKAVKRQGIGKGHGHLEKVVAHHQRKERGQGHVPGEEGGAKGYGDHHKGIDELADER